MGFLDTSLGCWPLSFDVFPPWATTRQTTQVDEKLMSWAREALRQAPLPR